MEDNEDVRMISKDMLNRVAIDVEYGGLDQQRLDKFTLNVNRTCNYSKVLQVLPKKLNKIISNLDTKDPRYKVAVKCGYAPVLLETFTPK